jgi:antirestriction protein ArdC
MLKMKTDVFQQITDAIAAQLEAGVRPWAKPWREGITRPDTWPRNVRGRAYRGANVFWLQIAQQAHGYEAPVWLTFKQALERGGCVRKGEKGTPVFFWKFEERPDPVTGKLKRMCWAKTYTVFNVAQCDGVTVPARQLKPMGERVAEAEALAEATGAQIGWGGNKAFYSPGFDSVQMPPREAFKSADDLYGTLFHELGHWTGHASRLDRDLTKGRFGDPDYAFEELVAELTSAFVCGSQGFAAPAREDHAAYIGHWLKVLRHDPRAFVTAASNAQKAADFLLAFADSAEDELEPEEVAQAA